VYYGTWNNCVTGNGTTAESMMSNQIAREKDKAENKKTAFIFERYDAQV
jgi:hypothetical protein